MCIKDLIIDKTTEYCDRIATIRGILREEGYIDTDIDIQCYEDDIIYKIITNTNGIKNVPVLIKNSDIKKEIADGKDREIAIKSAMTKYLINF